MYDCAVLVVSSSCVEKPLGLHRVTSTSLQGESILLGKLFLFVFGKRSDLGRETPSLWAGSPSLPQTGFLSQGRRLSYLVSGVSLVLQS